MVHDDDFNRVSEDGEVEKKDEEKEEDKLAEDGEKDKEEGETAVVAIEAPPEVERLEIGDDYYVIAFCSTLNKAKEQCPKLQQSGFLKYFYNVIFVCTMQLTLLSLVTLELYYADIYACHFYILTSRFLCAVLLHMTIEPEVRQAILMYRYFVNHTINFDKEAVIVEEMKALNYTAEKT